MSGLNSKDNPLSHKKTLEEGGSNKVIHWQHHRSIYFPFSSPSAFKFGPFMFLLVSSCCKMAAKTPALKSQFQTGISGKEQHITFFLYKEEEHSQSSLFLASAYASRARCRSQGHSQIQGKGEFLLAVSREEGRPWRRGWQWVIELIKIHRQMTS